MFFVFTFVHRNFDLWKQYRDAHVAWLQEHADAGVIRATGPFTDTVGTKELRVMIVVKVADEAAARALIETDPFYVHGVTEDLIMHAWNPFIGVFASETTPPTELGDAKEGGNGGEGTTDGH